MVLVNFSALGAKAEAAGASFITLSDNNQRVQQACVPVCVYTKETIAYQETLRRYSK